MSTKPRRALRPVTAVLSIEGGGVLLHVDDVLTKNERYQVCRRGRHAGLKESPQAVALKEAVRRAAEAAGVTTITAGLWRLEVLTVWPKQRHHDDGSETAYGDSDAGLSAIKDALQHAGVIDNDMRVVLDHTVVTYAKGERWTVARLSPVTPAQYAEAVAVLS